MPADRGVQHGHDAKRGKVRRSQFLRAGIGLRVMDRERVGFGFERMQVGGVLTGRARRSLQMVFGGGFEEILKDQCGLILVKKSDAGSFDGKRAHRIFGNDREGLLRVSAVDGRIFRQFMQHGLLCF